MKKYVMVWVMTILLSIVGNSQEVNSSFNDALKIGIELYNNGDYENAILSLNRALVVDSINSRAYFYRGMCEHRIGNYELAISDYSKVDETNKYFFDVVALKGHVANCQNDFQSAMAFYEKAYAHKSELQILSATNVLFYWVLALEEREKFTSGLKLTNQAIAEGMVSDSVYYLNGLMHYNLGNYKKGIKALSAAIALDSSKPDYFLCRAECYYELKKFDASVINYSHAIDLKPTNSYLYVNRGAAKVEMDDVKGAILDYQTASKIDSLNGELILYLGILITQNPVVEDELFDLGYNLYGGDYYLKLSLEMDSTLRIANYYLGEYFYANGSNYDESEDTDLAIEYLTKYLEYFPEDTDALTLRGLAYFYNGDIKYAKHDLRLAEKYGDKYAEKMLKNDF